MVTEYAKANGFPLAQRLALKGSLDEGDVQLRQGLHLECKGGNAAHNASRNQCRRWLEEATEEGERAGGDCFLVVKRKGAGAKQMGASRAFFWLPPMMVEVTLEELLGSVQ